MDLESRIEELDRERDLKMAQLMHKSRKDRRRQIPYLGLSALGMISGIVIQWVARDDNVFNQYHPIINFIPAIAFGMKYVYSTVKEEFNYTKEIEKVLKENSDKVRDSTNNYNQYSQFPFC